MIDALLVSLVRAVVVASGAAALAVPLAGLRHRRVVAGILWGLWLVPPLVWAYALAPTVAVWSVPLREVAGVVVLALRHVAPAVLVLAMLPPPPFDRAARFAAKDAPAARGFKAWTWGRGRNPMVAAGAVFLLTFQEFELASLLRLRSWTVAMFDAHAAGVGAGDLAPWVGAAVAAQVVVAGAIWRTTVRSARAEPGASEVFGWPRTGTVVLVVLLAAAAGPLVAVLGEIGAGVETVWQQGTLQRELLASVVMAAAAVAVAMALARLPRSLAVPLAVPALCGGLALGIGTASAFAWLSALGIPLLDTPMPLVLAWALWLLPPALVLDAARPGAAAAHCAAALRHGDARQRRAGRRLQWRLVGRYRLATAGVLFAWLQGEVLLAALLAPTAATPAALRLYNLMHYGQSTVLAGMVACVVVVAALPLLAASLWTHRERRDD